METRKEQTSASSVEKKINESETLFLESEEKKNNKPKQNLIRILNSVRENVRVECPFEPQLGLTTPFYKIEKIDYKHRRGKNLEDLRQKWIKSEAKENFLDWLDKKEIETKSPIPTIHYRLEEDKQNQVKIEIKNGKLYLGDELLDTTTFSGKESQYRGYGAYVMRKDGSLYVVEHKKEETHASILGGERVPSAGMIRVEKGVITGIMNTSGHYKPTLENLYFAVRHIPVECFSSDAKIIYKEQSFPKGSQKLRISSNFLLRGIGAQLGRRYKTEEFSYEEFLTFARKTLEQKTQKFIYKRDGRNNRYEDVLYQSY
ncbi:MAG: hypothetical protein JO131_07870, partial [Gammaproteobacteria bacterium]|nr:hypothetical protein [Gammaproteobacteria bacterium]